MAKPKRMKRSISFDQLPSQPETSDLLFRKEADPSVPLEQRLPPHPLMLYGESPEQHIRLGKSVALNVQSSLSDLGFVFRGGEHLLEYGCSNGRVLRHFSDWAHHGEAWGVDISSPHIHWANTNLNPPFHFAVCTTAPNLFFEDNYFNVIMALSVFTHADDLAISYLMELRRLLKPKGYLYATFHTENSFDFVADHPTHNLVTTQQSPTFPSFKDENVTHVCIGRDTTTKVFHKKKFLQRLLSRYFSVVNIIEGTVGGHQTAFLLQK